MNFAILTAGKIADMMASTISRMPDVCGYAIAARSFERADALSKKYNFKKAYGSYDELFCDSEVDIIYIASPHSHHYEHSKAAILHKKHVLCEKPATVNAAQLKELYALAKENNVVFCDAVWTRFLPFVQPLKKLLASGVIGKHTLTECSMGFCMDNVPRMKTAETAGGALMDLAIYPLTISLLASGDANAEISGFCTKNINNVDDQNAFTLKFNNDTIATVKTSMISRLDNKAIIYGTKGRIEIANEFWKCTEFTVYTENSEKSYKFPFEITGYEYEVRELVNTIKSGASECPTMPAAISIRAIEYLDALRESWGLKFPCEE